MDLANVVEGVNEAQEEKPERASVTAEALEDEKNRAMREYQLNRHYLL